MSVHRMETLSSNDTHQDSPLDKNDGMFPEDKIMLAVGVGAGLLFSLALLAIIGALAYRVQHVRSSKKNRRLHSTISMAHSDFDTFKPADSHYMYTSRSRSSDSNLRFPQPPQTDPSTDVSFVSNNTNTTMLYSGIWRVAESEDEPQERPKNKRRQPQEQRSSTLIEMERGSNSNRRGTDRPRGRNSAPEIMSVLGGPSAYDNKILSPTYLNRDQREQSRGIRKVEDGNVFRY